MASCSLTTDSSCFGRLSGLKSSGLAAAAAATQVPSAAAFGPFRTTNFTAEVLCFPDLSSMHCTKNSQKVAADRPAKKRQEISGPGPKKKPDKFLGMRKLDIDSSASLGVVMEIKAEAGLPGQLDKPREKVDGSTDVLLSPVHLDGTKLVASANKEKKVRKRKLIKKEKDDEGHGEGNEDESGEPKKKQRLKDGKSIHKKEAPQKVPGTSFKICANCGTVAEKTKAKKCQKCKKFFFKHWAKRCRIPPCPTCHYSRKAKTRERIPSQCERCGCQLPPSSLDQLQEYDSIHDCSFNSSADMELHLEQKNVAEKYREGSGEEGGSLPEDMKLGSSDLGNATSLPHASCSALGTANRRVSYAPSPNAVSEFEEDKHLPLPLQGDLAATHGSTDVAKLEKSHSLINTGTMSGESRSGGKGLADVKTPPEHVSLDFKDSEECKRRNLKGIGKGSSDFLSAISAVASSTVTPIVSNSAELSMSLEERSGCHPNDASADQDKLVQSKLCSQANNGSSNLERRVSVEMVEQEGRQAAQATKREEGHSGEDKKDLTMFESKREGWAKQGVTLGPINFQGNNNSNTYHQMQLQSSSHHPPPASHSPHNPLTTTLLDSILSPQIGTSAGGQPSSPACGPCTSPPLMALSNSPSLTPSTSPALPPSIVSFGAHSVVMSASVYPVPSTVASSNPAGTRAVVPPSVVPILAPSTSLAKNFTSFAVPLPTTSTGSSVNTFALPVIPPTSSTVLATVCATTNSTDTCLTSKLLPKVPSRQEKYARTTSSQITLAASDSHKYRSLSDTVCPEATASVALDVGKNCHPTSSFSTSDKNSLPSALLKLQACKAPVSTCESESKPTASKRCLPPSLISMMPCDGGMSDAPYSLPQAPRVSIIVAPPPLQNIKECPPGEQCQPISSSAISGISLIGRVEAKSSSESISRCSGYASQSCKRSLPPPLLCASLPSKSLAGSPVGDTTGAHLTPSRTAAINVISTVSTHSRTSKLPNATSSIVIVSSPPLLPVPNSPVAADKNSCRVAKATLRDMHVQNIPGGEGRQTRGDGESVGRGGGRSGLTSPVQPSSSFHRLDLTLSSRSPHTNNKIRVSLLKDSSEPGQDGVHSSPSPSLSPLFPTSSPLFPSSTRLPIKFYDFPRNTSGVAVGALSGVAVGALASPGGSLANNSAKPQITTTSGWNMGTVPPGKVTVPPISGAVPMVDYVPPTCKLQKPTVTPKLSCTSMESATSKSSMASLPQPGTSADGICLKGAEVRDVVISTSTIAEEGLVTIPDAQSSSNNVSFFNEGSGSKMEMATSNISSNSQQLMCGPRHGPMLDLEPKMDTITIERLASNVQMRINSAFSPGATKSSLEEAQSSKNTVTLPLPLVSTSLVTGGSSRTMGNYRRILPNLSKYPSTLLPSISTPHSAPTSWLVSSSSTSSFTPVRTPGLVTVHVCSSIPATLSLSSIMTPSISETGAGGCGGGDIGVGGVGGGGVIPSTYYDLGGNLDAKKYPHTLSSTSSCTSSLYPSIIKHRSVVAGGGNVMVTPLSPSLLPAVRTVAQIVTSTMGIKENPLVELEGQKRNPMGKISSRTRSRDSVKTEDIHEVADHVLSLIHTPPVGVLTEAGEPQPLLREESLDSCHDSGEQFTEAAGGGAGSKNKNTTDGTDKKGVCNEGTEEDGGSEEEEEEGEEEGAGRKGRDEREDSSKEKKNKRGGKRTRGGDNILYTIKLKDCYMHHMMWEKYRVVLIVPTQTKTDVTKKGKSLVEATSSSGGSSVPGSSSGALSDSNTPSSERRRRRKVRHEPLQDADEVTLGLDDPAAVESSPSTSSVHVRSPCFSMYELRLKHFRHMTNNAVYAYTYKHQIKSLRTPAHWVQVLRRMGGVQEHGHTFRLVDILRVKEMCQHFNVLSSWPNNLEALARNEFSKTRKLIDLSQFSPDQLLELDRLEVIPACPYLGPPTPPPPEIKAKRTYIKKKIPKEEKKKRKYVRTKGLLKPHKKDKLETVQPNDPDNQSCDAHVIPGYHEPAVDLEPDQPMQEDKAPKRKAVPEHWANGGGEEEEEEEEGEEEDDDASPPPKRLPSSVRPGLPSPTTSSSDRPQHHIGLKKKVCPDCSSPISRKCKKCPSCGKRFGVFTFGRRVCSMCGRINLARVSRCFQCSHSLFNAPKATPEFYNATDLFMEQRRLYSRTGSVFGAKKIRNIHSFFCGSSSSNNAIARSNMWYSMMEGPSQQAKAKALPYTHPKLTLNPPPFYAQKSKPTNTSESDSADGPQLENESMSQGGTDDYEVSKAGDVVGVDEQYAASAGGVDEQYSDDLERSIRLLSAGKRDKGRGPVTMKSKTNKGYHYGKIPWGEADITCLVDERGSVKVCLQELCSKVLHTHGKGDVFDMVKNLNLPVEHGDLPLLKKLQALGLHSNRSPICRLIASEELWTLLDALEESVPEEVYQHLDQMSTFSTPLLSPPGLGVVGYGGSICGMGEEEEGGRAGEPPTETGIIASPIVGLQSPGLPPSGTPAMVEEDEHGFETTLHEVECSDGQSVSILRAFNGEQFTCVTEFWRKYFPEVNRNHLTSALKRLSLETIVPTGQQATLLRSAGVISVRGAAGRLMKFENMEKLLEDFGIPLQIGKPSDKVSSKQIHTHSAGNGSHVTRPRLAVRRPTMCGYRAMASYTPMSQTATQVPPGKVLVTEEDAVYANCMRNVLGAIDHNDLRVLLMDVQQQLLSCGTGLGSGSSDVEAEINGIQQLIYSRRLLCGVLADEISYLTISNHGYMAESVRMDRMEKQFLKDVQELLNTYDISLIL